MMQSLGLKRILTLGLLIAANLVLAAGLYLYIEPQKADRDQKLTALKGQISEKQSDIDKIQIAFDQLKDQQGVFDQLRTHGFFGNQGRREAERSLSEIQTESGVISAVASIQPGEVKDDEEAQKADYKILQSSIAVRIEALDDADIYRYLYLLQNNFPGHITVLSMDLARKGELNSTVLRGIATGKSPPLVEAQIELMWRTMIPQADIVQGQGAPGG